MLSDTLISFKFNVYFKCTAGSDYTIPDTLSIDSTHAVIGDQYCLNATITDDNAVDNEEYFIVSFSVQDRNYTRAGVKSNYSSSLVTITEDTADCKLN